MSTLRGEAQSLDALAKRGLPAARPLLRLLSCYAPAHAIPLGLLRSEFLAPFLCASVDLLKYPGADSSTDHVVRGLERLSLIDRTALPGKEAESALPGAGARPGVLSPEVGLEVHPAIADTNRLYLLQHEPAHLVVRQTAVNVLAAALDTLADDRLTDWRAFHLLTPHLQALLSHSAAMLDDDHLDILIRATGHTATAYGQMGSPAAGIELITYALLRAAVHDEHATPAILIVRQKLAMLYGHAGRDDKAEGIYREIYRSQRRLWRFDDPANLVIRHNLAESVAAQGDSRWAEADEFYRDLLKDERRALGKDDPITLATRRAHATLLCRQERWAEAEAAFQDLREDQERVLGKEHPATLVTRFNLAQAVRHQPGRGGQAETDLHELREQTRRVLGDDRAITMAIRQSDKKTLIGKSLLSTPELREDRARTLVDRGRVLLEAGNREAAARVYRQVADWFAGDAAGVLRELAARASLGLSVCLDGAGDRDGAREAAAQAVRLYQELDRAEGGMLGAELGEAQRQLAQVNKQR